MTIPSSPRPYPDTLSRTDKHPATSGDPFGEPKALVMRKFQIESLSRNGTIYATDQVGPATASFEAAFSGFARGTLIKTTEGMIAVEDLVPGMDVITSERGPMPLLWIGSITLAPDRNDAPSKFNRLTRVMADGFGLARPAVDVIAGPGARVLTRTTEMPDVVGTDQILVPVRDLVDGVNIIEISPPHPVRVYHLCLHRHAMINVTGLDAETFHPGLGFERGMGPTMLSLFLSFFPHIHVPSDFGPLVHPRITASESAEAD